MSLTPMAAVKATFEGLGFGLPFFNTEAILTKSDGTPQTMPYAVITGFDSASERTGDADSKRSRELMQMALFQDKANFNPSLPRQLYKAMMKAEFPTAPEKVYRTENVGMVPVVDPTDPDTEQHVISFYLRRSTY